MSEQAINTLLVIFNMGVASWVSLSAIVAILHTPKERDLRPLVLPIFVSFAYVCIQAVVLVSFLFVKRVIPEISGLDLIWRLIELGFLVSLLLLVSQYRSQRS